jgi:hypothetical protein
MLWLIWLAIMLLVPVGTGLHVWWQLHHVPRERVSPLQPTQHTAQIADVGSHGIAES